MADHTLIKEDKEVEAHKTRLENNLQMKTKDPKYARHQRDAEDTCKLNC